VSTRAEPRPAVEAGQPAKPKLLVQVRQAIRMRQYSPRTEEAYVAWIKRYIFFHRLRHPAEMGADNVQAFLSHLAVRNQVSASTQNQALAVLLFLYRHILGRDIGFLDDMVRAKRPRRLPVVLTPEVVEQVFAYLVVVVLLIDPLLYGSGTRLLECLSMRIKDLDFRRNEITVCDGKGRKDRVTLLPTTCRPALNDHLEAVRQLHENDLRKGLGRAPLPDALARKYPSADRQWGWQFVCSRLIPLHRPPYRYPTPASPARKRGSEADGRGRAQRRPHQGRHAPQPASFIRQRVDSRWLRCPHRPGTARPQGPEHDHDLHSRVEPRWSGRPQPGRSPADASPAASGRRLPPRRARPTAGAAKHGILNPARGHAGA
jgi:integron integrase